MRFVVFWKTDKNILRRAVLRVRAAVTTGKERMEARKIIAHSVNCTEDTASQALSIRRPTRVDLVVDAHSPLYQWRDPTDRSPWP